MNLLLDTHYVFAIAGSPGRLTGREINFLAAHPDRFVVSAISIWEMRLKWDALHAMNYSVFGQTVIIPLLQKHRILTQVAGYHTEVIKFLPPIIATKEDMDWFLSGIEDVLSDTQRIPGAAWDTVSGLAKRAILA